VRANEGSQCVVIGVEHVDRQLIVFAYTVNQGVRFGWKSSGVECENPNWQGVTRDHVGQHHILGAKAARKGR